MGGVLTIEPPVGELRDLLLDGWELDRVRGQNRHMPRSNDALQI